MLRISVLPGLLREEFKMAHIAKKKKEQNYLTQTYGDKTPWKTQFDVLVNVSIHPI